MEFFLGGAITDDGERTHDPVGYRPSDLTTHGVIVGMTGSGKTGLGVIYLEEALRQGIPCLVIDPKGDMTNLLLTFPDLAPKDFLPWIDQAAVARTDTTPDEEAVKEATKWRDGLASWDLGPSDIGALRDRVGMTIYTPGSAAGVPINVVGDLRAPTLSWETDAETIRDEIQGFVSGLLGLIDVEADPIASREHILLANLIEHAWSAGRDLSLETLISQIITPPIRRLGVFDVDSFFPEAARTRLAMRLNSLLASPSFASWMDGDVLDIDSMMWRDGQPQAAIIYLAHLSDAERQFIVTTVLGKLITWMRSQQGSSELRLLTYMDEVFGFVPPTAEPPAKRPILTLLKQARAFGVGLLLSTQNPVDLDYKAMSNAGTWCVGRLQTERDKARILEAMTAASGGIDVDKVDARISALDKREFLLHSTREDQPVHFTTRWAMSYLRGPMTKEEVASVADDGHPPRPPSPRPASSPPESPEDGSTTGSAPTIADGIPVSALHPATGWADVVGWEPEGEKYHATIAISVSMRFDESRDGIDHTEQWEAVAPTLSVDPESMSFVEVDHDARDFVPLEDGLPFVMPEAPIGDSRWFAKLGSVVKARLDVSETLELLRNDDLDVVSRPGESAEDFRIRCARTAKEGSDDEMAALRDRYEKRIRTARRDYESAVREADSAVDAQNAASSDAILGAGLDLLMGRRPRASTSSNRSAANKVRRAEDKVERTRAAYEDLARDLDDELVSIQQRWDDRTGSIEPFAVGLESDDIDISEIRIVWVRRTT